MGLRKLRQLYKQKSEEFVATGTCFVSGRKFHYYLGAHPEEGLWVSTKDSHNAPIFVGFIKWDNIKYIAFEVDACLYIVVNDIQSVREEMPLINRIAFGGTIHKMKNTGEYAVRIPYDLASGNILSFLSEMYDMVEIDEPMTTRDKIGLVIWIVAVIIVLVSFLISFFS